MEQFEQNPLPQEQPQHQGQTPVSTSELPVLKRRLLRLVAWFVIGLVALFLVLSTITYSSQRCSPLLNENCPSSFLEFLLSPNFKNPFSSEVEDEVNNTADWQTYRNEKLGFEVKYPGDMVLKQDNFGDMLVARHFITRKPVGFESQSEEDGNRDVIIEDAQVRFYSDLKSNYYKPSSPCEACDKEPFQCVSPREYFGNRSSGPVFTKILGQDLQLCSYEFVESASYPFHFTVYIPRDENNGMVFDGVYSNVSAESFLETFSLILFTFKFIPSTPLGTSEPEKIL